MRLLDRDVFFFTTFGGETLSLAASIACIQFMREHDAIERIATMGERLLNGLRGAIAGLEMDYVGVVGYPCRTLMTFAPTAGNPLEMKTLVQQELLRRGVLWTGMQNLCHAHEEADIDYTVAAFREALDILRRATESGEIRRGLKGEVIQPVFRKTGNFHVKPRLVEQRARA